MSSPEKSTSLQQATPNFPKKQILPDNKKLSKEWQNSDDTLSEMNSDENFAGSESNEAEYNAVDMSKTTTSDKPMTSEQDKSTKEKSSFNSRGTFASQNVTDKTIDKKGTVPNKNQ